jgi:glycosyltransferase involved in cell wall biosynthesis
VRPSDPVAPEHVAVVIPVKNEEELLPRSVRAVQRAMNQLHRRHPSVASSLTLVLDQCSDGTAAWLDRRGSQRPTIHVLEVDCGNVGETRAAGVSAAIESSGVPPGRLWIANTDADSAVPPRWLSMHHRLALAGADMVLGTVIPDATDMQPEDYEYWLNRHELAEGHHGVFGANLGVRASSYLQVGGFPAVACGEDKLLVERLKTAGFSWVATDTCRVLTSGRLIGRSSGGFADYLRRSVRPGWDAAGTPTRGVTVEPLPPAASPH